MKNTWTNNALAWLTRLVAVAFSVLNIFVYIDEIGARQEPGAGSGDWFWQWAVLTHLIPLLLVIAATIVGWRLPFAGFIGFAVFTVAQTLSVGAELIYIPLAVFPPLVVTALFLIGWLLARRTSK